MDPMTGIAIAGAAIKLVEALVSIFERIWKTVEEKKDFDPDGDLRAGLFDAAAREALYQKAENDMRERYGCGRDELLNPVVLAEFLPGGMDQVVPMIREQMCLVMQPEKWEVGYE